MRLGSTNVSKVPTPDQVFGLAVKQLRTERKLSQEEVAFAGGISTSTVSRVERGLIQPSSVIISRVAKGLGVSLVELAAATEAAAAGNKARGA
ncbi:MAG: helix-turn-helix domain-containing protein [Solirubrobacteraceae bacterium]